MKNKTGKGQHTGFWQKSARGPLFAFSFFSFTWSCSLFFGLPTSRTAVAAAWLLRIQLAVIRLVEVLTSCGLASLLSASCRSFSRVFFRSFFSLLFLSIPSSLLASYMFRPLLYLFLAFLCAFSFPILRPLMYISLSVFLSNSLAFLSISLLSFHTCCVVPVFGLASPALSRPWHAPQLRGFSPPHSCTRVAGRVHNGPTGAILYISFSFESQGIERAVTRVAREPHVQATQISLPARRTSAPHSLPVPFRRFPRSHCNPLPSSNFISLFARLFVLVSTTPPARLVAAAHATSAAFT